MNNGQDNEIESLDKENKISRRMLALAYSGPKLYHDDGELQDSSVWPFIDFRNDSAEVIEDKIQTRGLNQLKEELARNPNLWEDLKNPKGNSVNIKKETDDLITFIETASKEDLEAFLEKSDFGSLRDIKKGEIIWPLPEIENNPDGSTVRKVSE